MFIAIRSDHSKRGPTGSQNNVMNISPGNGVLVSAFAAILLLAGPSGTATRPLTAASNEYERSGLSTLSVMGAQVLRVRADKAPDSPTEIMDSYESVPSLAALAKPIKTDGLPVSAVAERHPLASSGVSP